MRTGGVVLCDGDQDVAFANGHEQDSAGSAIRPTLPINESNQGRGLVDEAASRLPTLSIKGRLVVAFDIEGDGDEDLLFPCNGASQQRLHVNDGTGRFLAVTTALRPAVTGPTHQAEAADLDHDGDLDLAILSVSSRTETFIRNNLVPSGTLSFTSQTNALTGGNGDDEWLFVDFDNDGFLDLVDGSLQGSGQRLYRINGAFSFARQATGFTAVVDSTLDAAGALPVPIPASPPLIGLRVAFQCLFGGPLVPTNGVELVVCP